MFVTWKKKSGSNYNLRGCIGTFNGESPIYEVVPKYALIAAFDDRRFAKIMLNEVPLLKVSVSLLCNFTDI